MAQILPGHNRVTTILVPACPHLAGYLGYHPRFNIIQARLGAAVARESALIMAANSEEGEDESQPHEDKSQHQEVEAVAEADQVSTHSDGCVTAMADDSWEISTGDPEINGMVSERDFVCGILWSSSPRPELSSSAPGPAAHGGCFRIHVH